MPRENKLGSKFIQWCCKVTRQAEFWLVAAFLVALVILLICILRLPPEYISGLSLNDPEEIINFKRELIAIVLTAFGAWVGAGAAYFFGRENFQEAVEGITDAKQSVKQLLVSTTVKDLPRRQLMVNVLPTGTGKTLAEHFFKNDDDWFFVLLDADGRYVAAIHETKIWRLQSDPKRDIADASSWEDALKDMEVWRLMYAAATGKLGVDALNQSPPTSVEYDAIRRAHDIALVFDMDESVEMANAKLAAAGRYIGIILDSDSKPQGYFTTGDIRTLLTAAGK